MNMGGFSLWHWLIVLLVVVLVFGTKKLRNVGEDLGSAVRGFKEGMKGEEEEKQNEGKPSGQIIDGEATRKDADDEKK